MNKRENSIWDQMENSLKDSFKDPDVQQYIHLAHLRHAKWMTNVKEVSPTRLKTIRDTILPRVALYAVLKEDGQNADKIMDHYVRTVAGPRMHQMYAKMEKVPGFWFLFKNLFKAITDKSDNWVCESRKEKDRLYLNIHKCLWNDICNEVGYPECCRFFCECDNYTYGGLKKMGFARTQTLGTGGELCDFVMYKK